MTTNETVAKMFKLIREMDESQSPHFALGYLESMMVSLCMMSPQVLKEVIGTIDFIESKE